MRIHIVAWLFLCVILSAHSVSCSVCARSVQMLFENTARVPLLIHNPSQTEMIRTTELAELVDLYPTVSTPVKSLLAS